MIHIAGKPPYYNLKTKKLISIEKPRILIYGHSHILKVNHDKKNNLLSINPGAAGRHGFHKKRTMIRFEIDGINILNMEVIELGNRSKLSNSV
jgi:predicted phosphodiesterase